MNANRAIVCGALLMVLTVGFGAFGAHALNERLLLLGTLDIWHTAVRFLAWHGLGLILLGIWTPGSKCHRSTRVTGLLLLVGSLLFSGSLFGLALEPSASWLGPVTPIGGISLILGWVGFALSGQKKTR